MLKLIEDPTGKTVKTMFHSLTLPGLIFVFTDDTFMMVRASNSHSGPELDVEYSLDRVWDISRKDCLKHGVYTEEDKRS